MDREQKIHDIAIAILQTVVLPNLAAEDQALDRKTCHFVAHEYESVIKYLHEYKFS